MKAQLKCSNCGAEISNMNMSWGKKQWVWFIPFIIFIMIIPFLMDYLMKDDNDFRSDLSLTSIEKKYENDTIEIFGVIHNNGRVNWESIVIEAEMYSKDGTFLDELTRSISANILPGASEYFKISNDKYPESRWDAIHGLKVKVSDASHYRF